MSPNRIRGPMEIKRLEMGELRAPMVRDLRVGDRLLPRVIEVDVPGVDGEPALFMAIEVVDGVPRCTELSFTRTEGGREVRARDLRAVDLDTWVEKYVSAMSTVVVNESGGTIMSVTRDDEASVRQGRALIRDIRKGSRRPLTADRKRRVAELYNAQTAGGIEAVERAFVVSRSTAVRYIRAAREAGLIKKGRRV